jgi:hypothetical protein
MNIELVWLICPLVALLSQLGGTYNKSYRRWGVPSVITIASLIFLGFSWWLPVLFFSIFVVSTLPFTLVGDSLHKCWINWVWIWIAGYLLGLPSALISGEKGTLYALIPMAVQGILGTLSNVKVTAKYVPWKFFEGAMWFSMAYCYALSISLR